MNHNFENKQNQLFLKWLKNKLKNGMLMSDEQTKWGKIQRLVNICLKHFFYFTVVFLLKIKCRILILLCINNENLEFHSCFVMSNKILSPFQIWNLRWWWISLLYRPLCSLQHAALTPSVIRFINKTFGWKPRTLVKHYQTPKIETWQASKQTQESFK